MKKIKYFALCALMTGVVLSLAACGDSNNTNDGTDAPYEDEADKNNGVNNNMKDNTYYPTIPYQNHNRMGLQYYLPAETLWMIFLLCSSCLNNKHF